GSRARGDPGRRARAAGRGLVAASRRGAAARPGRGLPRPGAAAGACARLWPRPGLQPRDRAPPTYRWPRRGRRGVGAGLGEGLDPAPRAGRAPEAPPRRRRGRPRPAAARGLERRGIVELGGWQRALRDIANPPLEDFVDWLSVERSDAHEIDVGLHRHWIDPTRPFAEFVAKPAHGVLVTSATLTDGSGDPVGDWQAAEARSGARHLVGPALRARVPSPFDYAKQTRVFVVTDVRRDDVAQVAAAYRVLFLAAKGGALGLFTAIARLKAVYQRIAAPLEAKGLPLLAQHVDGMDTSTLVDIFRAEEDACLLGTDAIRDGVDVPGRSLRLIVFDRVPWPRPDILHKARRAAFGGARYDDMLTRLRLKQAFGRLVRRADDSGVFVLLDPQMPSRLAGAFPEAVAIERVGLKEAVERTADFLRR